MSFMMATLHRMFVYGTLKKGQPNHFRLLDPTNGVAKWLGAARLVKKYPLVVATRYNIPFLLDKEGEGKDVHGDLIAVDDQMLKVLDKLEVHPHFYRRTTVTCIVDQTASKDQVDAAISSDDCIDCETYLMTDFCQEVLSLPHHSSYSDDPERPYVSGTERVDPSDRDWWSEVKAKYQR